jgi:hypothetical protein
MKRINFIIILVILTIGGCEKQYPFENTTQNAEIVDFVAEKCGCCWGWVIKIDNNKIKSLDIPGLDIPSDLEAINRLQTSPIKCKIKIGEIEMDCELKPDYYEILKFEINK